MVAYRFAFLVVTSLLQAGSSFQAAAPPPAPGIKCDPKKVIRSSDCDKAWAKIKYEPDSSLFKLSRHIERASGNCVVIVVKTFETVIKKQMIEDGFKKMIGQCKDSYASYPLPDLKGASLVIRPRGPSHVIEEDAPFLEPVCVDNKNVKNNVVKADCVEAYKALVTDPGGRFVSPAKRVTSIQYISVKSCDVAVLTSDNSAITATKRDLDDIFGKMLDKCNGKWGGVPIQKGAAGPNGRLILLATPTATR
ncbi:hypothetical protein Pst134EA_024086 [Puccinia striiformis f. sp. tritici]|uniref:hypothetical protein n=1 Tax=Puccinia striiformis f. sp. tritici TaxID=168172 RepID=UPI002007B505|nr:hypothetical protein Pst134EA_024086 [Puccinia striiformis f. sp. tritici]KAH9453201.1 hypothetical protein Pst134EA_024086 [Puccinia striiformis f. sp. tritici]